MASLLWSLQLLNLAFVDFSIGSKISGSVTQDGVWFWSLAHHQRRSARRSELILVSGGWMGRSRTLGCTQQHLLFICSQFLCLKPFSSWTLDNVHMFPLQVVSCFICSCSFERCTEFVWVKQQVKHQLHSCIESGQECLLMLQEK